jgi:hypothetical protein
MFCDGNSIPQDGPLTCLERPLMAGLDLRNPDSSHLQPGQIVADQQTLSPTDLCCHPTTFLDKTHWQFGVSDTSDIVDTYVQVP